MTLDQWMEATGTSNTDLAKELGVSQPFVSRLRKGDRYPSLKIALRLSKITRLPAAAFAKAE